LASWPDSGSHTARHRGLSRSYLRDSRKLLDVELACFTLQRADRITRAAVTDVLDTITKPSTFNSAISVGSVVFNLAISRGKHEGINPFAGREKRKSQPRERVLTPSEMRTLWHTAEPSRMYDIGRIVRLLLLTGARPCEIGGVQLSEVDRAGSLLRIPAARMKARRGHPIPLLPAALDLLPQERAGFPNVFGLRPGAGFSGWSNAKKLLDSQLGGMAPWTFYSLRKTVATGMGELGVEDGVISRVLAHAPVGVTRKHYSFAERLAAQTAALERWADELARIVGA
jgi:integrase